ncbi:hypothetical protein SAMN00768000_3619 [Sulfobacillus thermosulfidooxidans DSM 9293]|uniref:Uncharacterized protein n=1 Tax=Sulfobacillus thermosulfidooxidans (strain DSM 9293 / VKM B-1269 / AT-1) TaxID=929705 RepID=A0A1W1WPB7_SULTA|nr:hypothetical protein [Sulfobacillus thermosulfidooxidans]SMC08052.1 hypothetical protein SAMN00768000_3619 [Sulfobacillus thermosulfidooxidans DSM 9293]
MTTWITLDADDSWASRQDKAQRWNTLPQPCYVLAGPGLYAEEAFLLISDTPWTLPLLQDTLKRLYDPADVAEDFDEPRYTQWLAHWTDTLSCATPR